MNKFFKGALAVGIGCTMLASTLFTAACGGGQTLDPEQRTLMLSIGAVDKNFNPFFYTSQNDGEMVSMTQIAMLTVDGDGKIACGDDWPTVVQDYTFKTYDKKKVGEGSEIGRGPDANGNLVGEGSKDGRTEYEFLIKNGILFSDGKPLTIKDVLFNLYVYLDYAYTGSNTMYSTDIQGLVAYRTQTPNQEEMDANFGSDFRTAAETRIYNLIQWSNNEGAYGSLKKDELPDGQLKSDLATVEEYFAKEIESDWNALSTSWKETYKHTHSFTEVWQAYLYQEGLITEQTKLNDNGAVEKIFNDKNGNGKRDDDENNPENSEKYYTTIDENQQGSQQGGEGTVRDWELVEGAAAAVSATAIAAFKEQCKTDPLYEGVEVTDDMAKVALWKKFCLNQVFEAYTSKTKIKEVLSFWATGSEVMQKFIGDASTEYFQTHNDVPNISGITTKKVSSFNGKNLDGEYDVLKIVINGIDPKAIFNFAFTVAPLHYYSGEWEGRNYVTEFNGTNKFGVAQGSFNFFRDVLGAVDKNFLPVGAGAYKATNRNGDDNSPATLNTGDNIMRFKRNDYFYSTGRNIQNAKIKFVNYKVYNDDQIMEALVKKEIDYAMPNASDTNFNLVTQNSGHLKQQNYLTGGYGYVGINPKNVPEYKVRQAIMKSFNINIALAMYQDLAQPIYRPMSKTSWAYPDGVTAHPSIGAYQANEELLKVEIQQLVYDSGYNLENGEYVKRRNIKNMTNAEIGAKLNLEFVIAGEVPSAHPSYRMFLDAKELLDSIGFKITVKPDGSALKKLATGGLAVWAAAWSSSVDPDMYQVYHMDSKASSVNNWNYPDILKDPQKWKREYDIIRALSTKIDEGREYMTRDKRIEVYGDCLDMIMELAVEFPVYQRNDLCVYNKNVIDENSLVKSPNYNMGLFAKIWEINYV